MNTSSKLRPFSRRLQGRIDLRGKKRVREDSHIPKTWVQARREQEKSCCVIKPIAYDLEGVVSLLKKYKERDAKGYAIESLWKFLLYAEMASAADASLRNSPHRFLSDYEKEFLDYCSAKGEMLSGDFTIRLQRCSESTASLDPCSTRGASAPYLFSSLAFNSIGKRRSRSLALGGR